MTDTIKLLTTEYRLVRGVPVHNGAEVLGLTDALAATITLHENLPPSHDLYVFLHEVIHSLMFMGHFDFMLDDNGRHDERKIDAVASLLAQVIKDNYSSLTTLMYPSLREDK